MDKRRAKELRKELIHHVDMIATLKARGEMAMTLARSNANVCEEASVALLSVAGGAVEDMARREHEVRRIARMD